MREREWGTHSGFCQRENHGCLYRCVRPERKNGLLPNGVEAKTGPAPDATDRSKRAAASASQGTVWSRPDLVTKKTLKSTPEVREKRAAGGDVPP